MIFTTGYVLAEVFLQRDSLWYQKPELELNIIALSICLILDFCFGGMIWSLIK